jgi:hypothetical protein
VGIKYAVLTFGTCLKHMIKNIILSLTFGGSRYVIDVGGHSLLRVQC